MARFQVFAMCKPLVMVDAPDTQSAIDMGAREFGYPDERTMCWETEQQSWMHAERVSSPATQDLPAYRERPRA